ncbi:Sugar (and other) transporter [Geosmithia morbida]|uniref:Sugar (And other) transporter n=1 Tax=Geosmithia morbida TaxID=1094350 RepID=A0A9P5D0Q5_9HYPO|nr:Sugar (and other) transporter [Geosmithia morbida]KAF4121877.1 Sugar (and other) transporter [Geosmithia morbida]
MAIGNIYIIAGVSVVGGALFGFDISSLSAQLGMQSYLCYFNEGPKGPPFDDNEQCSGPKPLHQGGITAAMSAGSWLGALISGYVSDILGRKKSIMIGCIVWLIGSIISCASQNIPMLAIGRMINGLAVGIESAQVPVYIAEISPPSKRGRFIGFQQWAITWGILIMYYMSYGCYYIGENNSRNYNTASFRVPWALQMVPAIFLFFMMMPLPESPRWLARKDRWEDCHSVLTLVHGKGDPNHPFVMAELQDIKDMCEFERRHSDVTYLDLFRPRMIHRTITALFTQIWSQLTGMNVMMYYIANIFSMAGYEGDSTLLASSIQYVLNVVMTLPALIWMDKWGRRGPLLTGALLMAIWMFINAGVLATYGEIIEGGIGGVAAQSMKVSGSPAKALIASTYLFVCSYAPTWGPTSWAYPPELFPLRLRSKGVSLATSGNWAFNTALGLFVPEALANIKWRTYIIFGVFLIAMFIHTFFLFPETAGKTLEELEAMFDDPNGIPYIGTAPWKTHVATSSTRRAEAGDLEARLSKGPVAQHTEASVEKS